MARINKAKNFAGKSYVVSNEIESLINSLSFENNILKFGATAIGDDGVALGNGINFSTWISEAKAAATAAAVGQSGDAATVATVYGAKKYTDEAKAAVIGTADDTASMDTIKGAKADATAKANKAFEDAKAYADGIAAEAISVVGGNGISIAENGVKKTINVKTDLIKLEAGDNSADEFASVYALKIADSTVEGGYTTVGTINIPKDQFLKDAKYENGKINLTFAVADKGEVVTSIEVGDLIDTYTAAAGATEIQLKVENNEFSATIVDGAVTTAKIADDAVTEAKLNESVNASLDKADSAIQAGDIARIEYNDSNVEAALDDIYVQIGEGGSVATQIKNAIDALDGSAVIATEAGNIVTIKAGVVETDGKVAQSGDADIVLAKVAKTGAAADISVADTENVIVAENVEGALVEIATQIDAMNATTAADTTDEDDSAIQGVQVVKSITQANGKLTVIETAKADKFGSASKALADAIAYTDTEIDKVVTAVNAQAVQFVSASLPLSAQITSGVVEGRVIAVYGKDGDQVYPEITFADNKSTIKVEGLENAEEFTVIYATTITIA